MLVVGHHIIEAPPQFANENQDGGSSPGVVPSHSPTASSPGSPGVEVIKIQKVLEKFKLLLWTIFHTPFPEKFLKPDQSRQY